MSLNEQPEVQETEPGQVTALTAESLEKHMKALIYGGIAVIAVVVVMINPNDLFSAGPQLSFLAVAVLIWLGVWIERLVTRRSIRVRGGGKDPRSKKCDRYPF